MKPVSTVLLEVSADKVLVQLWSRHGGIASCRLTKSFLIQIQQ